ncbi:restriction endonuclease subunit S [Psychrobacter sp. ANT_WB68]|uniref:restriction endonuclease subunit S n=1 Tax=Psychrobacter sp. ANT_WB68 TaxID=2597355 RepID=UPI0011F3A72E|nr:restriction endonuclease subunit S [Psychrobacter sp. ANT_WB68]KAA0913104.1 restriction endonuclease subunit S [Psychrobacter sp. ANT_WB68]
MRNGWNKVPLAAITELIKRGVSPKYVEIDGYPIINQKCIREESLSLQEARMTSKSKKISNEKFIRPGDVLINSTGTGTLGRTAIVKNINQETTVDTHVTIVRGNDLVDKYFLGYLIRYYEPLITSLGKGATNQIELSASDLKEMQVKIPISKETQQKIANILSAYDDLIEHNKKRIELLEEQAQLTYEEWFIRMKFPDYEDTLVDEETGLPEGWVYKTFADVVDINPKTSIKKGAIAPFIPMSSISTSSMSIDPIEERAVSGGTKFKNGDTLFARITPCLENGKTGFVQFMQNDDSVATGSTEYIVLRETKSCGKYFIYCASREEGFRENAIKSMVGSDGRQRVNTDCFEKYIVNFAPKKIRTQFEELCAPIFRSVQIYIEQNNKLKEARDILLPRLMMGVIEV